MKQLLLISLIITGIIAGEQQGAYERLLHAYVCNGQVDYSSLATQKTLIDLAESELQSVSKTELEKRSESEQIAHYINLYNFFTIKLIVDNLPLKSIRDITQPWDKKFVPLNGKKVSLNYIEHEIIRKKYDEPRIHFALVCASIGCPPLLNEPFTGAKLSEQMDAMAKEFLTDTTKNYVKGKKLYLSKIFEWYGGDFKNQYGSYEEYVKGVIGLDGKYTVRFNSYDWNLNSMSCQ